MFRRSLSRSVACMPRGSYSSSNNLLRGISRAASFSVNRFSAPQICQRFHSTSNGDTASFKVEDPQLMIAFTCKKCDTRSSHTFSKQAYTKGTVAIQCPGCKNRHLIADNLNIFKDQKFSLEEVLKARGESVSTSTDDLVFNDIPESLRSKIGHHAKDAPEEYHKEVDTGLPEGKLPDGKK